MKQKAKLGLALSGGGARGIAHIGVIKAFEENDIEVHAVAGTSAGSIVGALFAAGKTADEMLALVKESSIFKIYKVELPDVGLTKLTYISDRLKEVIPEDQIEAALRKVIDLTPRGIRRHLNLNNPIYARTAAYGHFGRTPDEDA